MTSGHADVASLDLPKTLSYGQTKVYVQAKWHLNPFDPSHRLGMLRMQKLSKHLRPHLHYYILINLQYLG